MIAMVPPSTPLSGSAGVPLPLQAADSRGSKVSLLPSKAPVSALLCTFQDPHMERQFRNSERWYAPASFAALLLFSSVMFAAAAAAANYINNRVDPMLIAASATCVVWVLCQWCMHHWAFGTPFKAMKELSLEQRRAHLFSVSRGGFRVWIALSGMPAFFTLVIMVQATVWAFDADASMRSRDQLHLYSTGVVAVLPMAFGLGYPESVCVQAMWYTVFFVLSLAHGGEGSLIYGSLAWALFLVLAVQVGAFACVLPCHFCRVAAAVFAPLCSFVGCAVPSFCFSLALPRGVSCFGCLYRARAPTQSLHGYAAVPPSPPSPLPNSSQAATWLSKHAAGGTSRTWWTWSWGPPAAAAAAPSHPPPATCKTGWR